MILWIVVIGVLLYAVGRGITSTTSHSDYMTARQFYRDEYRNEWREVNDPLYIELKMSHRAL